MRSSRTVGKRGARQRSEAKERFWREHVARQAAGGLSIRAYCRRHMLAEPSFYAWRRELARRDQAGTRFTARSRSPSASSDSRPRNDSRAGRVRSAPPVKFVRLDVRPEGLVPDERIEILLVDGAGVPGAVVRVPRGADPATLASVLAALTAARAQPC